MKAIYRLSDTLIVNFADVRLIRSDNLGGVIEWRDGTTTTISLAEANLAITRHREIYDVRADD